MYLVINDHQGDADLWGRLAAEAGLENIYTVVAKTPELIAVELRKILSAGGSFKGAILDYTFQNGNASELWKLLKKDEKRKCGKLVVVTAVGGRSDLKEFAMVKAQGRLIETLNNLDRKRKLQDYFLGVHANLDVDTRIRLLEEAVNDLSDRVKKLGG